MLNGIRTRTQLGTEAPRRSKLIHSFINGDDSAFAAIYRRYERPILSYLKDRVRDDESARDLLQEVFLKIHRFRHTYRPEFAFSTWLWTIARNTSTDWLRQSRPELAGPMPGTTGSAGSVNEPPTIEEHVPCSKPRADKLLERRQRRRILRRFLFKLTREQRRVIWLRVIHQLSYQEISKKLDLSLSAVKCLAYRSKMTLMELGTQPHWNTASGVLFNAARII